MFNLTRVTKRVAKSTAQFIVQDTDLALETAWWLGFGIVTTAVAIKKIKNPPNYIIFEIVED